MDAVAPLTLRPGFQPAIAVAVGASPVQKQSSGLQPSRPQALTPSAPMPGLFPSPLNGPRPTFTDAYNRPGRWVLAGHSSEPTCARCVVGTGVGYDPANLQPASPVWPGTSSMLCFFSQRRFPSSHLSSSPTTVVGSTAPTSQRAGAPKGQRRAFELLITIYRQTIDSAFTALHASPQ